jgi:hypothetical protein
MTRFALADNEAAASRSHVPYVLLAEFDFASGFLRVNSGVRSYEHNGETYLGTGSLASVGPVRENGNLSPEKVEFQLAVDTSLLSTVLTEDYHARGVSLWVGYLNESLDLITTPQLIWEGLMDVMMIRTDANTSIISLTCENRLINWNKSSGWLYTDEHQKLFDPDDEFFSKIAVIQNLSLKWGGKTVGIGSYTPPVDWSALAPFVNG